MTDDELITALTEEIPLTPDGTEEAQAAVFDLQKSWREFRDFTKEKGYMATHDYEWWKRAEYLMLADSRLKQLFCGSDLSPASIKLYHRYRLKLCVGGLLMQRIQ